MKFFVSCPDCKRELCLTDENTEGEKVKKPFAKGDRVRVYATLIGDKAETSGVIVAIREDGCVLVEFDKNNRFTSKGTWAHPKQCRRLITKRRVWVQISSSGNSLEVTSKKEFAGDDWVEFVEVKKK